MFSKHKEFGRKNLLGGTIQLVHFFAFSVNNFLVPSILGAHTFGLVAISLSVVYMLQGLFEVSFVGTTINLILGDKDIPEEALRVLRLILKDLLVGGSLCAAVLFAFAPQVALWFGKAELSGYLRIAALIIPLLAFNTFLLSLAYSRHVGHALIASIVAGVAMTVFPFLFCVLILGGGYGAMLSALATQLVFGVCLAVAAGEELRAISRCRAPVEPRQKFHLRKNYITLVFPRLLPILINTGSVLVVGAVRTGAETAIYKMALALTTAFNRLIPASPHVLQASIRDMKSTGAPQDVAGIVSKYVLAGLGLSTIFSILGYWLIPIVCRYILGAEHSSHYDEVHAISLCQPLLFLITILPPILLAWERIRGLTMASLAASVLYILTGYWLIYRAGIKGAILALLLATTLAALWMLGLLGDLFPPRLRRFMGVLAPWRARAERPSPDRDKAGLNLTIKDNKYEPFA